MQQRQHPLHPNHPTLCGEAPANPTASRDTSTRRPAAESLLPGRFRAPRGMTWRVPPSPLWLLLLQRPQPAAPPRGRLSRAYPRRAAIAAAQPPCVLRCRALGPSEGPVSPRADLGRFLFPSSASVPFISGDGPQERKVTPRGPGSAWNCPLLLPRGRSLPPPTKIPSRWFRLPGGELRWCGIGAGGRRTSLRPEPLLPD